MSTKTEPTYGPLVETCNAHGISRTIAFELARDGILETFAIGRRRYVFHASVRTLPERLSVNKGGSDPKAVA